MTNSKLKTQNSKLLLVSLLLLVVLTWSEFGIRVLLPVFKAPHWPNPAYWVAARLATEGRADLIYPDRAVFFQQSARLGAVPDIFEANMPTTILVFLPLAPFSLTTAYIIWDIAILLCYILACALLLRALALPPAPTLALWAVVPLFHPWRENISRGQAYPLVLLLLVLGTTLSLSEVRHSALRTPHSALAGLAFGLIAIVKFYYAAVLLLPALLYRRWQLLLGAAAIFALAVAVTFALWGPGMWISPIGYAITWRDRPETAVTSYQTLNGILTHMLRYDATWNRGPVANLPELVGWLWWVGAAVILLATCLALWIARRNYELRITNYGITGNSSFVIRNSSIARSLLPFALVVPVALVLSPAAEDYHFVMILFPLVLACKVLWDMYPAGRLSTTHYALPTTLYFVIVTALAVSALLLGAPWRFNVQSVGGWSSLLHYPRLYGSLLLWLLIMALIIAERRSPAGPTSDTSAP
jgi:hypothetical protein